MQQALKKPQKVEDAAKNVVTAANISAPKEENIQEIDELQEIVSKAKLPGELKEKALKMVERLRRMARFGSYSGEYELIEKYVNWIINVPWGKFSEDNLNLENAKELLDRNHFGLKTVKDRILEYLAVANLNPYDQLGQKREGYDKMIDMKEEYHAPILCFVGIQGIGKTSMAKSIARALGRKFVRISLGAMASVTDLKGQSRAFLDAEPGQVIKALARTEVMNPLILLDEIDKISEAEGRRADINAVLLEILDPEQNSTFVDSYLDYPVDLSRVMFVTTANNLSTLTAALLDRLEIIRFPSYTDEEKQSIAKHYLFPKALRACGLKHEQLDIAESVWPLIIRPLGFDAGVRQLERNIKTICRRAARKIVEGTGDKFVITPENFREYIPADIGIYS